MLSAIAIVLFSTPPTVKRNAKVIATPGSPPLTLRGACERCLVAVIVVDGGCDNRPRI